MGQNECLAKRGLLRETPSRGRSGLFSRKISFPEIPH